MFKRKFEINLKDNQLETLHPHAPLFSEHLVKSMFGSKLEIKLGIQTADVVACSIFTLHASRITMWAFALDAFRSFLFIFFAP